MKIVNKRLSLKEFEEYVSKKDFGELPPTFMVLHHTWKPTKEQWKGQSSISGLKSYYEGLGWSAGPHLFIAEDGIWLFTDMYDVGIHAGAGNGTLKTGYSIGIEVVGNYDYEVWSGETYTNTIGAIKALQEKLKLPDDRIKFHRDYSAKSCPGWEISMDWVKEQLKNKETPMATKYYINSDLRNALKELDKDFDHEKESDHKKMADKLNSLVSGEKFFKGKSEELTKELTVEKEKVRQANIAISQMNKNHETDIESKNKVIADYVKFFDLLKDGSIYKWDKKESLLGEVKIDPLPQMKDYNEVNSFELGKWLFRIFSKK